MRHTPYSDFSEQVSFVGTTDAAARTRFARASARLLWILGWPGRVIANRREMALLGAMSDAQLKDIGLARQDIYDAVSLPHGEAPGPLLTRRAAERRRAALARRR